MTAAEQCDPHITRVCRPHGTGPKLQPPRRVVEKRRARSDCNFAVNVRRLPVDPRKSGHNGIAKSGQSMAQAKAAIADFGAARGDTTRQHPLTGDYTVA